MEAERSLVSAGRRGSRAPVTHLHNKSHFFCFLLSFFFSNQVHIAADLSGLPYQLSTGVATFVLCFYSCSSTVFLSR